MTWDELLDLYLTSQSSTYMNFLCTVFHQPCRSGFTSSNAPGVWASRWRSSERGLCPSAPSLPLHRHWLRAGMLQGHQSTGLRAVEQEPVLLCRRDLFFHRLREEAKPAAVSFLRIACKGSPSQHVPWEGTAGCSALGCKWLVVISAPRCRKLRVCSSSVIPVVAGVFSLGSPLVSLIPQHLHFPTLGCDPAS